MSTPFVSHLTLGALAALSLFGTACLDPDAPGNLVPKTVDEDPALPRLQIADTLLHAEAFGDPAAPLVVMLHGGPGSDYRNLLPLRALADEGFRVVFWDQRGAGLSRRHDGSSITLPKYIEDLRLVVEAYTVVPGQPVVFVGHSWGAMYATIFINEHGTYGGRIKGAVLSEPGAFTKKQLDAFVRRQMSSYSLTGESLNDALWARELMSAADHARADYLNAFIAFEGPPNERHDPKNLSPMWRFGAVVSSAMMKLAEDGFDWTTRLSAFTSKVLFLRGDLNTVATLEHQRELAAAYPNAEIVTMSNVGHQMQWERPQEYLAHLRKYLGEIGFAAGTR